MTNQIREGVTPFPRSQEGHQMNYTQPNRQYKLNVLTDAPYTDQVPSVTITEMYYDYRKTDSWKRVKTF